MSYCTIDDMRVLLPKNITIGDATITTPTLQPNLPTTGTQSTVPTNTAQESIKKAGETIDATLRSIYVCPLQRIKTFESDLTMNASLGDSEITVRDNGPFDINTLIRISDNLGTELHYVDRMPERKVTNVGTVVLKEVLTANFVLTEAARISILEFPDPIPLICARLAVSIAFDRIFVAEQQPDISTYGKTQRNLATRDIDKILIGVTRLEGQNHVGTRFARTSIMNKWRTPVTEYQPNTYRDVS